LKSAFHVVIDVLICYVFDVVSVVNIHRTGYDGCNDVSFTFGPMLHNIQDCNLTLYRYRLFVNREFWRLLTQLVNESNNACFAVPAA